MPDIVQPGPHEVRRDRGPRHEAPSRPSRSSWSCHACPPPPRSATLRGSTPAPRRGSAPVSPSSRPCRYSGLLRRDRATTRRRSRAPRRMQRRVLRITLAPIASSIVDAREVFRSEPLTSKPRSSRTFAIADIPAPPIPTKCVLLGTARLIAPPLGRPRRGVRRHPVAPIWSVASRILARESRSFEQSLGYLGHTLRRRFLIQENDRGALPSRGPCRVAPADGRGGTGTAR